MSYLQCLSLFPHPFLMAWRIITVAQNVYVQLYLEGLHSAFAILISELYFSLSCVSQVESKPVSALLKSRRLKQVVTATKDMSLRAAQRLMAGRGLRQVPVVDGSQRVVGLLDRDSIALACR